MKSINSFQLMLLRGLCGIFDGDKSNDFHDRDGRIMDLKMSYGQVDLFPEQWRFDRESFSKVFTFLLSDLRVE